MRFNQTLISFQPHHVYIWRISQESDLPSAQKHLCKQGQNTSSKDNRETLSCTDRPSGKLHWWGKQIDTVGNFMKIPMRICQKPPIGICTTTEQPFHFSPQIPHRCNTGEKLKCSTSKDKFKNQNSSDRLSHDFVNHYCAWKWHLDRWPIRKCRCTQPWGTCTILPEKQKWKFFSEYQHLRGMTNQEAHCHKHNRSQYIWHSMNSPWHQLTSVIL